MYLRLNWMRAVVNAGIVVRSRTLIDRRSGTLNVPDLPSIKLLPITTRGLHGTGPTTGPTRPVVSETFSAAASVLLGRTAHTPPWMRPNGRLYAW
ncbi:hypothetical protein AVL48_30170 [Amycolatopsis regifaucium]|uniref:Uncharacterized protein n=1 Tax=Amycolatopsis regifaucium TaxID=546365 RepID=A0A154MN09_9PSEU|nr:hypothetical protein AVL48_30170 [Amycolatopsis regifaucium]